MKESVKITVIAAGFREVSRKQQVRPSYIPKTWKAVPEPQPEPQPQPEPEPQHHVVEEVRRPVPEIIQQESSSGDLDVPTFLRRQVQKA
jgi:hypothetical protein